LKKIKSPFLASSVFLPKSIPVFDCSIEVRGSLISNWLKVEYTKPEQSNPDLLVPAVLYLTPIFCDAESTISSISLFVLLELKLILLLMGAFSLEVSVAKDGLQEVNKEINSDMYNSCFKR
jgi:hypothetical protein